MTERDIHKVPWRDLTEEEREAIRAEDRRRHPGFFGVEEGGDETEDASLGTVAGEHGARRS